MVGRHVYHARVDYERRGQGYAVTERVSNGERYRVFFQFPAMRQKPVSTEPVKNDGAEQKEKLRRGIEQARVLALNVQAEDDDRGKTAADAERKQKLAVAGVIAAYGGTVHNEVAGRQ